MYSDNNNELIEKHLKFTNKLVIMNLIFTTLICIEPSIWLIIRIINNDYEKLLLTVVLSILTVAYMSYSWSKYFYSRKVERLEFEIDRLENK